MGEVFVQRLARTHDRKSFDCGHPAYNEFLQKTALQHARQRTSVTWVAVEEGSPRILGYITLSMGRVDFEHIDETIARKLPKHPVPVLHVGKLAVDRQFQGKGIAPLLLRFAGEQAIMASQSMGCHAVELIADTEALVGYYQRLGFLLLKPGTLRLYLPVETIERAMGDASAIEDA